MRSARVWMVMVASLLGCGTALALDPPLHAITVGQWDGYFGSYCDIWSDGQYAYLPNWTLSDGQPARVHIVDISDPNNPFLADTFFLPLPNTNASPQDVKVANGLLFIGLEADPNDSVAIVDVRDPLNAVQLATVRISGFTFIHNVFYDNGYLYMADSSTPRVGIIDLTGFDPDNPPATPITTAKWILSNVGSSFVHDITVKSGRMYAAGWNSGLLIYDVSDVANTMPNLIGSVGGNSTHSMWPTDDGRFVVTGEERTGGGITVYEIVDNGGSLTLQFRDAFAYSGFQAFSVHNQMIIGNRLYNSWYEKGLQVFDIDPIDGTLTLFATLDTSDTGLGNWGVYPLLGDNKILLSDGSTGLHIVDITLDSLEDPTLPPAPDDILKNRYLSIAPGNETIGPFDLRVTLTQTLVSGVTAVGDSWWANEPDLQCLSVVTPTMPATPPDWSGCPVVHLTGCPIIPTSTYEVAVVQDPRVSNPIAVQTQAKPSGKWWGDCVGFFDGTEWTPPQGFVAIDDTVAVIKTFQDPSAFNALHISRADLAPADPTQPFPNNQINRVVNIDDAFMTILGFQGEPYPGPQLELCPDL